MPNENVMYIRMKEGSCLIVCLFVALRSSKPQHMLLRCCVAPFLVILLEKALWWVGGALSWFHNVSTYGGEVIEYWTIFFSLKSQLNQKKICITEFFEHALGIVREPLMSKDLIKVICKFSDLRCGRSCSNHLHILRFKVQASLVSHINPTPIQQTNTFKRDLLLIRFLSLPF
jgi:hypothetical protein